MMTPQQIFKTAREYQEIWSDLKNKGMTNHLRHETSKRLGLSLPQGDRYKAFSDLIPEVQNLIYDYNVGMSSLLVIAPHTLAEQRGIYDILLTAQNEGYCLVRTFVKQVVDSYRDGKHCWDEIKADCPPLPRNKKSFTKPQKHPCLFFRNRQPWPLIFLYTPKRIKASTI